VPASKVGDTSLAHSRELPSIFPVNSPGDFSRIFSAEFFLNFFGERVVGSNDDG
jgi:hypothetical protein